MFPFGEVNGKVRPPPPVALKTSPVIAVVTPSTFTPPSTVVDAVGKVYVEPPGGMYWPFAAQIIALIAARIRSFFMGFN
jgi:hypothetical protein